MTDSLRGRCELFVGNRHILKEKFKFETTHMLSLCAYLCAAEKSIADTERIAEKRKIIRKKGGRLSNFASFSLMSLSTLNSLDCNASSTLDRTYEISAKLQKKIHYSSYLPLTAYLLAKFSEHDPDTAVDLTLSAFDLIKKFFPRHKFNDDIVYAALLTISGKTEADLLSAIGDCTLYLSSSVSKQSVKQLSIACTINGNDAAFCCQRFIALRTEIEKRGIRIDKNDRYSLLHVFTLACIKIPEDELADEIFEIYGYLKDKKGFGFTFGRVQRLIYAILLLYGEYVPENEKNSDAEIMPEVKGYTVSVLTSVSAVICAEISWALAAISVI